MNDWFYLLGQERLGPVSLADLNALIQTRRLAADGLVWTAGMASWTPVREVPHLQSALPAEPPPPPPPPMPPPAPWPPAPMPPPATLTSPAILPQPSPMDPAREVPVAEDKNRALKRFLARSVDWFWQAALILAILEWLKSGGLGMDLAVRIIFWPPWVPFLLVSLVPLLMDALLMTLFGNTPGKVALGLRVVRTDRGPGFFSLYLKRNVLMLLRGLALNIPPVNLGAAWMQCKRVKSGKETSYDQSLHLQVTGIALDPVRENGFMLLFAGFLILLVFLPLLAGRA